MIIFRKSKKKLIIPVGINPNINYATSGEVTSQSKTVDSSTNEQTVIPDEGYDYLDSVKVNPYSLEGGVVVLPSEQSQTITPSEGYDGFSSVTVEGLDIQQATVNSSTNEQVITPDPSSYFDSVTVHPYVLQEKSVESSTFVQTIVPDSGYDGLSSVDIQSYTLQDKTVNPSVNSQTVTWDEGYDGIRSVTVNPVTSSIDSNIQAANIKMGVSILGVTGTLETVVKENDVNFIDYDGTLLYSYTQAEFLSLSGMPENPVHEGLIAKGWNWTFEDAQAYVQTYEQLVIGQMYVTDDGKTRIYIENGPEMTFYFNGTAGTVLNIDWGDSSEIFTHTFTEDNENTSVTHNYNGADSVMKIYGTGKVYLGGEQNFAYGCTQYIVKIEFGDSFVGINKDNTFSSYANLTTVSLSDYTELIKTNGLFNNSFSLKSFTFPRLYTKNSTDTRYLFDFGYNAGSALESISFNAGVTNETSGLSIGSLRGCINLKLYHVPRWRTFGSNVLMNNDKRGKLVCPNCDWFNYDSFYSPYITEVHVMNSPSNMKPGGIAKCPITDFYIFGTGHVTSNYGELSSLPRYNIWVPSSKLADYQSTWTNLTRGVIRAMPS